MMHLLTLHGLWFVFADVLLAQLGLPIPAMPTLIVAGAAASGGKHSLSPTLAVAISAAMAADTAWFVAGRVYGPVVLKFLWRLSLFPGFSIQQAKTCFERWAPIALVLAKFLPGLSTIAPPLAGSAQYSWAYFLLLDGIGTVLWAGIAVGLGNMFHVAISGLIKRLEDFGEIASGLLVLLLIGYIVYRFLQHRRFCKILSVARITVEELQHVMSARERPVIVDLRSTIGRYEDPRSIPGSVAIDVTNVPAQLNCFPKDREIVFYCTHLDEAAATRAAKKLIDLGYLRVRPLLGGLDAWIAAKYEVEFRRLDSPELPLKSQREEIASRGSPPAAVRKRELSLRLGLPHRD